MNAVYWSWVLAIKVHMGLQWWDSVIHLYDSWFFLHAIQFCSWHCRLPRFTVKPQPLVGNLSGREGSLLAQDHLIVSSKLLWSAISVWVVLVSVLAPDIVLIVHVGGIFLSLMVSTLAVVGIHAW